MATRKPIIPKDMLKIVIPTAIVLIITVVVVIIYWDAIISFFQNPEQIKEAVKQAGPWGPIVFIAVQFLQILIAPIPGQAVGFFGGGIIWAVVGSVVFNDRRNPWIHDRIYTCQVVRAAVRGTVCKKGRSAKV